MASDHKTLYEVLGVRRGASATEIGRAYERIRAEMRKENVAPNPRLAAMAKVAYETLSDPERRAEDTMAATCRGITALSVLTVSVEGIVSKAPLASADGPHDVCLLHVKGAGKAIAMRPGPPTGQEKLQAVLPGKGAALQLRQVHVTRSIPNPQGTVLEVKAAVPLPNGTPVFDAQARLVAIVVAPHAFGEGVTAALGAARIAQARGSAPAVAAAPAAMPAREATQAAPASPEPAPARGSDAAMVAEGFTSLWREDEGDHRLVEVLDEIRTGDVGVPIAYWTKWAPRGGGAPQSVHCRVTYGPKAEVVADYTQDALYQPGDEYLFCALTRFQVALDDLRVGDYHFEIFVDGRGVAENSIRIEKRFFTRGTWGVIAIVAGLGLLAFLRRNKVVSYAG